MPAVRPEFGPTLPELAGPRLRALPRPARIVVLGAAAVVVLALLWALLLRGDGKPERRPVVVERPVAFNFGYRAPLAKLPPPQGALARVASPGLSFTVRELRLPPYRGDSAGTLPIVAGQLTDQMRATFDGFQFRQEGRANINRQQGYEIL
ncbi:MAG: hypothetical protein HZB46_16530, partial [Solirubrobacterales bacterium]|nr:hypothetical protein [Solirubrobacterales bacterium]